MIKVRKPLASMRRHTRLMLALVALAAMAGCVTEPELERSPIRVGMSRQDLRFFFGEPVRIEAIDSGGEDWYYRFVSSESPQVDGAVSQDPVDGTGAVAVSVSGLPGKAGKVELPIHLSAEGRVIEPIPEGKLLRR